MSAVAGAAILRARLASGDVPLRRPHYTCRSVASLSYFFDRLWPSVGVVYGLNERMADERQNIRFRRKRAENYQTEHGWTKPRTEIAGIRRELSEKP
eukprot:1236848-Pleurochrysis_carterae.AAC.1